MRNSIVNKCLITPAIISVVVGSLFAVILCSYFASPLSYLASGVIIGGSLIYLITTIRIRRAIKLIQENEIFGKNQRYDSFYQPLDELLKKHAEILDYNQRAIETLSDETDIMVDRYEVLTENLAAAIIIRDANGKIAYCSPYTEVLTGYKLNEIYAKTESDFFFEIIHPEYQDSYTKALKISTCGEAFQFRCRFYHKTGIEMWAETRTVPIMDDSGNVTSTLSITFDITSLIHRQQQIEEKNHDLEDFSYMISHDLKSPIFTVKGMLQILQEDLHITPESPSYEVFQHITAATNRLEQLVQSVLSYSRIGTTAWADEDVDTNSLLNDINQELQPQLTSANCTLKIADNIPAIHGDHLKIYQIFSNLIGNAIKYRSKDRPAIIEITSSPFSSHYVQIEVKDNGLGIPENRIQDIFRPFQRAHGKDIEGSGIGLACVKKIVSRLNGDVSVVSKENEGSTFKVTLPLAEKHISAISSEVK